MTEDIKHNIACIIADSLRWETFAAAEPKNIIQLGTVRRVFSIASCTLPSIMSYLMNYPPIGIGRGFFHQGKWEWVEIKEGDAIVAKYKRHKPVRRWMPLYYQKRGYKTIWMSANAIPNLLDGELDGAIQKNFDYWETTKYFKDVSTPDVIRDLGEIVANEKDNPLFAVILLMDTHSPYHDGKGKVHEIDSNQPDLNRHWQIHAMKYVDEVFPNFISMFRETGRPTEFIFTSDHGENMGGPGYGHTCFRPELKWGPELYAIPFLRARIDNWEAIKVKEI